MTEVGRLTTGERRKKKEERGGGVATEFVLFKAAPTVYAARSTTSNKVFLLYFYAETIKAICHSMLQ